jgi:hypothetical protein
MRLLLSPEVVSMRRAMRGSRLLIGAIALVVSAAGCDCGTNLTSVAPTLEVTPEAIAFGKVAVGTSAEQLVDVRNGGRGTLEVSRVFVSVPSQGASGQDEVAVARVFATDCQGNPRTGGELAIAGGECARFAVRFAPGEVRAASAEVTIESNDGDRPVLKIPVTGMGVSSKVRLCVLTPSGEEEAGGCTRFDSTDPAEAARLPEVAFGAAPIEDTVKRVVRVHNDGEGDLVVSAVNVVSDFNDFAVEGAPVSLKLAPAGQADVTALFKPTGDGPETGRLVFLVNDLARPTVELPMTGEALGPRLCYYVGEDPLPAAGIDFGQVQLGQARTLTFKLKNCGLAKYNLNALAFGETPAASPANYELTPPNTVPALPRLLLPGDEVKADLTYTPRSVAVHAGNFGVQTDYQTNAVPVKGEGVRACSGANVPVADVRVKTGPSASLTDITATASTTGVEPLTIVTFDGAGSTPRTGARYRWRLVSQPTNGTQNILPRASNPAIATLNAELNGEYVVELIVADSFNCESAPRQVRLKVASKGKVHVQLTWPQNFGDVDLHFIGPGGRMFSDGDCYWFNCEAGNLFPLDWGSSNTTRPDNNRTNDPTLDIDDEWGNGPENTTHDLPFDGTYQVWVHYFCSRRGIGSSYGATTPSVKIFVNGQLAGQPYTQPNFTARKTWHVADVVVSNRGMNIAVNPVTNATLTNAPIGESCPSDEP